MDGISLEVQSGEMMSCKVPGSDVGQIPEILTVVSAIDLSIYRIHSVNMVTLFTLYILLVNPLIQPWKWF